MANVLNPDQLEMILMLQEERCFFCFSPLRDEQGLQLEIRELIRVPHQLGGKDVPRNTVLGCKECKQSQNTLSASDFLVYWKRKSAPFTDDLNRVWGSVDRWWKSQPKEI
jgi:hypothetical protein